MPCVFCGHPETTREHVFPRWLSNVLPDEGTLPGGRLIHQWVAPEGHPLEDREWKPKGFDVKAKVVCQANCNGGWMNDLEHNARPFLTSMIQGRGRTLHAAGRRQVAYWALKTAMMIDHAQPVEHRCVPDADYPVLYETQDVLPNTFVWLARCTFGPGAFAHDWRLDLDHGGVNCYAATVNVGHLVMVLIRIEDEDGKSLEIGGQLASALRRLWPENQPVAWPPAIVLTRQQVERLPAMIERSPIFLSPP